MKSYDVFLDSFVNVLLPDGLDPNDNAEGTAMLYRLALEKYRERLRDEAACECTWRRYPDGDTGEKAEGRE